MSAKTKWLLLLASLIGLLQTAWFTALVYPIPRLSNWVTTWQEQLTWSRWLGIGLGVISGLVFLGLLLLALFRRKTVKQLNYHTDHGTLSLNKQAVEKNVQHAIKQQHPVDQVKVSVKLAKNKKKTTADIKATTAADQNLVQRSQAIKQTAATALENSLGVRVKKVTVHLTPQQNEAPKAARVV